MLRTALLWLLLLSLAFGQEDLIARLNELAKARRYAEAVPVARQLVEECARRDPRSAETTDAWGYLAQFQEAAGDPAGAAASYQEQLARVDPDSASASEILAPLVSCLLQAGQYPAAVPLARRAAALSEKLRGPDDPLTITAVNDLGVAANGLGDLTLAESCYRRALAARERVNGPDDPATARSLNNLGWFYTNVDRFEDAEPLLQRAVAISERVNGPEDADTAIFLNSLGYLYAEMADLKRAEPLLKKALAIRLRVLGQDHPDTALTLSLLASLYQDVGLYSRAEPLYQQSLAISERTLGPDHVATANALSALGKLYWDTGAFARSEQSYTRALAVLEKSLGPDTIGAALVLECLAMLAIRSHDTTRAEALCNRALSIWERAPGTWDTATATGWNQLALIYLEQRETARALPLLQRATKLSEGHPSELADALFNLSRAYQQSGDLASAQASLERCLAVLEGLVGPDHPRTVRTLDSLARLSLERGDARRALELERRAQEAGDRQLAGVLSYTSEQRRLEYRSTTNFYSTLAGIGSARDMANSILRHKGIVLESLLEDRGGASPAVLARLQAAKERLRRLDLHDPARAAVSAEVDALEGSLGRSAARAALSVTVEQVQAVLPQDTVLIEFVRYQRHLGRDQLARAYGAVVIARSSVEWVDLGLADPLEEIVSRYQKAVRRLDRTSDESLAATLHDLYAAVWKSIPLPSETHRVLLCPDDRLSFVSFATLLAPDDRFLAESLELSYVASGRDLLKPVQATGKGLVAVGDPVFRGHGWERGPNLTALPGTARECAQLAGWARDAGWPVTLWLGAEATEPHVRAVASPRVLHLATHGFFLSQSELGPMQRSGLAFTGAQATVDAWQAGQFPDPLSDGVLTADEVAALNLRGTWLVTLSACDTGLGEVAAGEGVLGLRRGFLQAGALNLLLTLWPVPDQETVPFMAAFYAEAARSGQPARALAAVQRQRLVQLRGERGLAAAVAGAGAFILSSQGPP